MSISRGASPLVVWLAGDGGAARQRVVPLGDGTRHFDLHDLLVGDDGSIGGWGFSDAPMTHSGDGNNSAGRTFGPLVVRLAPAQ
jgi:hypothetical protein